MKTMSPTVPQLSLLKFLLRFDLILFTIISGIPPEDEDRKEMEPKDNENNPEKPEIDPEEADHYGLEEQDEHEK